MGHEKMPVHVRGHAIPKSPHGNGVPLWQCSSNGPFFLIIFFLFFFCWLVYFCGDIFGGVDTEYYQQPSHCQSVTVWQGKKTPPLAIKNGMGSI